MNMEKKYIISYELRDSTINRMPFYDAIKSNWPEYRHIMENSWIIKSEMTAKEIYKVINPFLHLVDMNCDTIFIAEINDENVEGMLGQSHWKFISHERNEHGDEA